MSGRAGRDFSPLATADPVPGNPGDVAALSRQYADTAQEIERQAQRLRTLASRAGGGWDSDAGRAFAKKAADLAGRIEGAHHRYVAAADALKAWVGPLEEAQSDVDRAVEDARSATSTLNATTPVPPTPGAPPPTDAQQAAAQARASRHSAAADQLSGARSRFDEAVGRYHDHAGRLARRLDSVTGHDDVHDGFWDKVGGWIHDHAGVLTTVVRVLGYVGAALAIAILVVGMFLPGVDIVEGIALGTALGWLSTGLTGISLVADTALAADGDEGWYWAAMDVVGIASFGASRAISGSLRSAVPAATSAAADEAGARASADVFAGNSATISRYTRLNRIPGVRWVVRAQAHLDGVAADAASAGSAARAQVLALGDEGTSFAERLRYGGLWPAKAHVTFARLEAAVPGVPSVEAAAERAARLGAVARVLTYAGPVKSLTNQAILHVFHWKGPSNATRAPIFTWP